jgi:lysophospholipase L1-like esterase
MSSRSLRILCFGDSLTSGYCAFGTESHPYSLRLEDRLYGALPRDTHIEVFTSGVPGDLVTNTCFKDRLDVECLSTPTTPYHDGRQR